MKERRFEGLVARKRVGAGSKSDREAVVLRTDDGEFVLRREGGNAFSDPQLDALVGHRIRGVGHLVAGSTVILKDWEDVPAAPPSSTRRGKGR